MDEPRNIFTARKALAESRSILLGSPEGMVDTCICCGSQEQFVTLQGTEPGDVGWAFTPEQARRVAAELVRVAEQVEAENAGRSGPGG